MKKLLVIGTILALTACADTPEQQAKADELERISDNQTWHDKRMKNLRCIDGIHYFGTSKYFNGVKIDPDTLKPETCDWIWEK